MAVPHYAYLKLKMPGSTGFLTVNGSFIKSDQCDRDFHKISDTLGAEQELREIAMVTDKSTFPLVSRSESKEYGRDFSIDSDTTLTKCTRRTRSKQSACTPTYQRSRRQPSSLSFEKNGKYSPGAQPTCLEYHANSRSTPYASSKTQSR